MIVIQAALFFILFWFLLGLIRYGLAVLRAKPLCRTPRGSDPLVAACLGDSITYGTISCSYLSVLRHREALRGWSLRNGGGNSWQVPHLLSRLDQLLTCHPDVVVICIGTNDLYQEYGLFNKSYGAALRDHVEKRKAHFRRDLEDLFLEIRDRLGPGTPLAILSIPPLGEDFASPVMSLVKDFNRIIEEAARNHDVTVLPLFDVIQDACLEHNEKETPVFMKIRTEVVGAIIKHFWFFLPFDRLSEFNQFLFHVDYLHLNYRGASAAADLVEEYLVSLNPQCPS